MSIFYWVPWSSSPMGGIKQAFRHVEALADAGWSAYILIAETKAQNWFNSRAPLARVRAHPFAAIMNRLDIKRNSLDWIGASTSPPVWLSDEKRWSRFDADDIIVVPEFYGNQLPPCRFGSKIVVFNQNAHYTFSFSSYTDPLPASMARGGVFGVMAVSEHIREYLNYAFPSVEVLMTPNGIDPARFYPSRAKKRQIAFMPRKLPHTIVQVLQILRSRGTLAGWELCPIDGMGEDEVARHLRESAIFLSTCHDEGFGLPPLEAGASGCIVVGYCGQAAKQFMLPEFCYPVAQGDVLQLARTLEEVMARYATEPDVLLDQADAYAAFIRTNYSLDAERKAVVEAWTRLCGPDAQRRGTSALTPSFRMAAG